MEAVGQKQVCFKCNKRKSAHEFYEKGISFLNCSKCRKARVKRKRLFEVVLNKEKSQTGQDV